MLSDLKRLRNERGSVLAAGHLADRRQRGVDRTAHAAGDRDDLGCTLSALTSMLGILNASNPAITSE